MKSMERSAAALSLLLLCACAEAPKVDWKAGAKRAWVVALYEPGHRKDLPACLLQLSDAELATRHFVELRYRHVRIMYTAVAELPPGLAVTSGTQVELWPADCGQGHLSRISRLLPASSD